MKNLKLLILLVFLSFSFQSVVFATSFDSSTAVYDEVKKICNDLAGYGIQKRSDVSNEVRVRDNNDIWISSELYQIIKGANNRGYQAFLRDCKHFIRSQRVMRAGIHATDREGNRSTAVTNFHAVKQSYMSIFELEKSYQDTLMQLQYGIDSLLQGLMSADARCFYLEDSCRCAFEMVKKLEELSPISSEVSLFSKAISLTRVERKQHVISDFHGRVLDLITGMADERFYEVTGEIIFAMEGCDGLEGSGYDRGDEVSECCQSPKYTFLCEIKSWAEGCLYCLQQIRYKASEQQLRLCTVEEEQQASSSGSSEGRGFSPIISASAKEKPISCREKPSSCRKKPSSPSCVTDPRVVRPRSPYSLDKGNKWRQRYVKRVTQRVEEEKVDRQKALDEKVRAFRRNKEQLHLN